LVVVLVAEAAGLTGLSHLAVMAEVVVAVVQASPYTVMRIQALVSAAKGKMVAVMVVVVVLGR
jgi:hypothetical protein